jgi:HK97 family phage major capsid protein
MAANLNNVLSLSGSQIPLPESYAATLLKNAFEQSLVGQLTPSQPVPMGTTVIPVYEGGIEAGPIAEGERKPVGTPKMSHKTLTPQKFGAIVIVSEEMAETDPLGTMDLVETDLQTSIARAIDLAIFHGRSAITGAVQPGWQYINQTTIRQALAAGATGTDLGQSFLDGAATLGANGFEVTGFAFDPLSRYTLVGARDAFDRPVFQAEVNLSQGIQSLFGLPAAFGNAVPGRIGASADTGVKAFAGDWSKLRWGYAKTLTLKRSTEAVIQDADGNMHYLFQENKLALLAEAIMGWTILWDDAFVAFDGSPVTGASGASAETGGQGIQGASAQQEGGTTQAAPAKGKA